MNPYLGCWKQGHSGTSIEIFPDKSIVMHGYEARSGGEWELLNDGSLKISPWQPKQDKIELFAKIEDQRLLITGPHGRPLELSRVESKSEFNPFQFEVSIEELPFLEPLGLRDSIFTFQSQFSSKVFSAGNLDKDTLFLHRLNLRQCYSGAGSFDTYPILIEIEEGNSFITGRDVLKAFKVRDFRSKLISSLDQKSFSYLGYHPYCDDEIHNDYENQFIFVTRKNIEEEDPECLEDFENDPSFYTHDELRDYVVDKKLWYILLHTKRKEDDGEFFSDMVILLAIGLSPNGHRALGVITQQVCHNLCD